MTDIHPRIKEILRPQDLKDAQGLLAHRAIEQFGNPAVPEEEKTITAQDLLICSVLSSENDERLEGAYRTMCESLKEAGMDGPRADEIATKLTSQKPAREVMPALGDAFDRDAFIARVLESKPENAEQLAKIRQGLSNTIRELRL